MTQIILWIMGITTFTLFGAWYARRFKKPDALIALYVVFVAHLYFKHKIAMLTKISRVVLTSR